ncbi:hypothetical protein HYX09_00090 [Candidatus Woesearchaeota archaeon]|nr:hypothetical protein [Candidatus Woesearchaeota archaeon]
MGREKIKLRWKLAAIFVIIPIFIFILVSSNIAISNFLKEYRIGDYLIYIYLMPLLLLGKIIEQVPCDGLGCIAFFGIIVLSIIILFYGILGYLIGFLIEKLRKKK